MTQVSLRGAPVGVLLDEQAIAGDEQARRLLAALGLPVVLVSAHEDTLSAPTVGIFGSEHGLIPGCHAWYVGPGPTPSWMHATAGHGAGTTVELLGLLGTALLQESAAVAFRATSAGHEIPRDAPFDSGLLLGVSRTIAPPSAGRGAPLIPPSEIGALLRSSLVAIEACCSSTGAIAAAPRSKPGQPNYWFCWQRDAAAVALALHGLAHEGPHDLRARAAELAQGYVGYVERLGQQDDLAGSRCTMEGVPVQGYGDPQLDGPASTILAVLTLDPEAVDVVRPFVEYLLQPGQGVGFDLWELIQGRSFHAVNLRRRALRLAARTLDHDLSVRCAQADDSAEFEDAAGRWVHVLDPEPSWFAAISRLDISVLGSALLGHEAGDLDDPHLTRTVEVLEQHFANRWSVNAAWHRAGHLGAGIGRFPEDANDGAGSTGGNPWPIATLWMAQYHLHRGNRPLARGYLNFILAHVDADAISEQIDGTTGQPRGARGLAWAHAEMITTLLAWREPLW